MSSQIYSPEFVNRVLAYEGAPRSIPDLIDPGLIDRILDAMRADDQVDRLFQEDNGYGDPLLHWLIKRDLSLTEGFVHNHEEDFDIFTAVRFGCLERVMFLLVEDASLIDARNSRNWTPLDVAAHEGHEDIARFLLDRGANPNSLQPLMWAGQNGFAGVVAAVLEAGGGEGNQARDGLSRAAYRNRPKAVAVFLKHGVPAQGLMGCAAYGARVRGKVDIFRTLIQHGADAAEKDEKGQNALYSQISFYGDGPNAEITEFLIANGAEVDIFNASGLGLLENLRGFIAADPAAVHARSGYGLTPLHYAAMGNQLEAAKLLVAAGADKGAAVSSSDADRPVDKVRVTDGQYVTCDTGPLREFLTP